MAADTYAEWSALLAQAKLGVAPAELHGSVTGFLCSGRPGRPQELLASLALESDPGDSRIEEGLHALLERAATGVANRLRAREPVELLLPAGPLAARADAAVDWCRGFLGGLGLTGVLAGEGRMSDVRDLLADFGHIAAMHLACGDDDDAALDDVLDFIRGGVAHLYAACAPAGSQ